jgi:hypothetical protein
VSKLQKISFYVFIALALVGGIWAYQNFKAQKQPNLMAINGLSDSCLFFIKIDDFSRLNNLLKNNNLVWQDVKQLNALHSIQGYVSLFDSIIQQHEPLKELLSKQIVYTTIYEDGNFLSCFNLNNLNDASTMLEWFPENLQINSKKIVVQSFQGVVVVSNSTVLVRNYFNVSQKKLIQNQNFKLFYENNKYRGIALYCAPSNTSNLLTNSYSQLNNSPNALFLNGVFNPDSLSLLSKLKNQEEQEINFLESIPLVCTQFEAFGFGYIESVFSKKVVKNDWWQSVSDSCLFDAKKQFYQAIGNTLIKAQLPSKHYALLLPLKDTALYKELQPYTSDSVAARLFPIHRLMSKEESFIQSTFPKLDCHELLYACLINDYLVLTNTIEDADIFINAAVNKSSILLNRSFTTFAKEHLGKTFNYIRYCAINQQEKNTLPFTYLLSKSEVEKLKNINHFAFVCKSNEDNFTFRLTLNYYQENSIEEPTLLWTFKADTTIVTEPFLFKNHNTGDNELCFQTANNKLYLQSTTGQLIWKKQLNERVRSPIYIVDAFKKNKFQLLFNTDNYLHLIDRNGNYVQGYPVKLPSSATNQLSVLSYEGKNDLRLFISCANNNIYNYSIWGIPQEGFKPFKTENKITLPIYYCHVGASDYLMTADIKGKIYAFSRKGDGRIDFKNKLPEFTEHIALISGNQLQNTQLFFIDKMRHSITKITLTDKKEEIKLSLNTDSINYSFNDIDKNGIQDIILNTEQELFVYDFNGAIIDKQIINNSIKNGTPNSFVKEEVVYYVLANTNTKQVMLLDKFNASSLLFECDQVPLICDLFKNERFYLISILHDKLKAYELKKYK